MRMLRRMALVLLTALPSCKQETKAPGFVPIDSGTQKPYVPGQIDDTERDTSVKPVYPVTNVVSDPLAQRFCEAIHTVPRKRFAECCNRGTGVVLTSECVRNLSGALAIKAISLAEAEVAACEAAANKAHEGCDWVGPWLPEVPRECRGIVRGTIETGTKCRSSLECKDGLRCLGVGPTDQGICGPPPSPGKLCGTAVDTLAVYARQDDYELQHPSCAGFCEKNRCYEPVAIGAACKTNAECGRGNRCADQKCVAGAEAKEGESCLGGECQLGLRCVAHKCVVPKPLGATCTMDQECKAACNLASGEKSGKCEQRCDALPVIPRRGSSPVAPVSPVSPVSPGAPGKK